MNARVLVLNASFEPINVCTERRAVVMIFKGVARMEEHNGHMLHSQRIEMHAPSVIRLTEYRHIPFERRSLSRKNILLRDHSCCQYCGKQFAPSELTQNFSEVTDWIKATGASKLVVHFDLDVLDPKKFREQLFNNPAGLAEQFKASPTGQMDFDTVVALLNKCAEVIDIVGLTIAEHLPWDAENLRAALAKLPILSD